MSSGSKRPPSDIAQTAGRAKVAKRASVPATSAALGASSAASARHDPKPFTFVSWNTDGLDENETFIVARAKAICDICKKQKPDIIVLQEVTPATVETFLNAFMEDFDAPGWWPEDTPYFTMAFVRRTKVTNVIGTREDFASSSRMGRDMLTVRGVFNSREFLCVTSHLESLKESSKIRCGQFSEVLKTIVEHRGPALFAGDTNLREPEAKKVRLANSVVDVWEAAGRDEATQWTFDTKTNDNCPMHAQGIRFSARYDRAFVNAAGATDPISFQLVGTERTSFGVFPSDHYGMLATLQW